MINLRTNIYKLGRELIPYFLRSTDKLYWSTEQGLIWVTNAFKAWTVDSTQSRHKHWVESLLSPIDWLNTQVAIYAIQVYYRLSLSGQVIYIEHYLNDLFDDSNRGIYISDDSVIVPPYMFNEDRPDGLLLYNSGNPIVLFNESDYEDQGSFIVHLPSSFSLTDTLEKRIRAAVNQYRQAGANFTIIVD